MQQDPIATTLPNSCSLPMFNVQSLSAEAIVSGQVPEKFIRSDLESDVVTGITDIDLPVIDMERLLSSEFSSEEFAKLELACQLGFFQLINHGVPHDLIELMKSNIDEFFKLPLEEKMRCNNASKGFEGYRTGTLVTSDSHKWSWSDSLYILTRPIEARNLNVWPTNPSSFRDALSSFSSEIIRVTITLLEAMAKNLGVEPEALLDKFKSRSQNFKFNYYPPCPKADKVLGLAPHSDGSIITILLEANNTHGLQIKIDSKWFIVQPMQGALLVNIGDILEILSNGIYKSIEHRVTVNSEKARMSIIAFQTSDKDGIIGPLPELVKDGKAKYKTLPYRDFVTAYISKPHEQKSQLEGIKLSSS